MLNKPLETAIKQLCHGGMIILTDDKNRENEADLVFAAEHVSAEKISFMLNHAKGVICLSLDSYYFEKFDIPMQHNRNNSALSAPFGMSIEASTGVSSGVSAKDRAHTIQTIVNPLANKNDISIPGHVFTLKGHDKGLMGRAGHTEGSLALMALAQLQKAAVICEIMCDDGTMMRGKQLIEFANKHQIPIISNAEIIEYLQQLAILKPITQTMIPTELFGELYVDVFQDPLTQKQAIVLHPQFSINQNNPMIRIHSSCFTGDILSSLRCDCGEQLTTALHHIVKNNGLLIYLDQEGRDIGLVNKLKAYALQDKGLDTVQANEHLQLPVDKRDYYLALSILKHFSIHAIQLITNNPKKIAFFENHHIDVTPVHIKSTMHQHNQQYLLTKQQKLNHHI